MAKVPELTPAPITWIGSSSRQKEEAPCNSGSVSVAELEPLEPSLLLRFRSRSKLFCRSEPECVSNFFNAAPAASFSQVRNNSIVLESNMTLMAVLKGKYCPK